MLEKTFLIEIGTEELPPKSLRNLAQSFAKNFIEELDKLNLIYTDVKWFASPRRLALQIFGLSEFQPDREIKIRGPSVAQAFNLNGKPSKILNSWIENHNITLDQIENITTDKGRWLFYRSYIKGKDIRHLLPSVVISSLLRLPIKKIMRWGESDICFVRPVHTVTMLLGSEVINAMILGIKSDRIVSGHRFMGLSELVIHHADQYPQILLENGKVIADYEIRKTKIKNDAQKLAYKIGGYVDLNESLLEEVNSLVEWPVVLSGKFDFKFLSLPKEILVYVIKNIQKCFPIYTFDGNLSSNFLFVSNVKSSNAQHIIIGNERVMKSRLTDAEYFFNTDCKSRLEDNLTKLKCVLFQNQLGNMLDKSNRISILSKWIASKINANVTYAARAGILSKCDLITNMVFEFTGIQGTMGMYYARLDGEAEDVAIALNDQYNPRFAGDILPSTKVACAVAIADKIDTIVGILGIGKRPTGDKDPFALRRAALGVLRIILEKNFKLDLKSLIEKSVHLYSIKFNNLNIVNDVINFILLRCHQWYLNKGYSIDAIKSVLVCHPTCLLDFDARVKAVTNFRSSKESEELIIVNKRISNILKKSNKTLNNNNIYVSMLANTEEINLVKEITILRNKLKPYFIEGRYQEALIELTSICQLINNFFDNVMINVEDQNISLNRLTILYVLRELFLKIADISLLQY